MNNRHRQVSHLLPRSAIIPAHAALLRHSSPELPPAAAALLADCLAPSPADRPTAAAARERVEHLLQASVVDRFWIRAELLTVRDGISANWVYHDRSSITKWLMLGLLGWCPRPGPNCSALLLLDSRRRCWALSWLCW